jgi:hypothetical protein
VVANIEKNAANPNTQHLVTKNRINKAMNQISLMNNITHLLRGQLARRLNNVMNMHPAIKGLRAKPNAQKRLQQIYTGVVKPTRDDVHLLASSIYSLNDMGWKNVANKLRNVLKNVPIKTNLNKLNASKLPKALYHGSGTLLKKGYPNKPGGTWFAKTPHQSILHALARSMGPKYYLYVYHFREVKPKLIDIKTSEDFDNLGLNLTRKYEKIAFSNENYQVAKKLCRLSTELGADGWHFPRDQDQIMLCEPKKFLKLYRAYTIEGSGGAHPPNFRVNYAANQARWLRPKGVRYGLKNVPIKRKNNVASGSVSTRI